MDLGFALSAASTAHNETFQLMKDVINYIIVTYGTQKIHHSVLVYSDTASIEIKFGQTSPSPQQLKTLVENLRVGTGTPNLADALSKAAKMFEDDKRRPLTHKVLVIMADSRSGSTVDDVKTAAKPLMDMDIEVIPVVVGEEADPDELGNTTPDKTNVIETGKDGDPKVVGEKIMDKIRGGRKKQTKIFKSESIKDRLHRRLFVAQFSAIFFALKFQLQNCAYKPAGILVRF